MSDKANSTLKGALMAAIACGGGKIPFAHFMALCLYHESEGYYQNPSTKLGKDGDFYTSAHIGAAMGQCIAVQWAEAVEHLADDSDILVAEWGAGDGRLAKAALDELRGAFPSVYCRIKYIAVENSPLHQARILSALTEHKERVAGVFHSNEEGLAPLLQTHFVIVLANELLDAFPIHRLKRTRHGWEEIYVAWDAVRESFIEVLGHIEDDSVAQILRRHRIRGKTGQIVEVNLEAHSWIRRLGEHIRKGFVMIVDYGDGTEELFAAHRMNGTFLCYRNHIASDNPYEHLGTQDMTAHVNFDWVQEWAAEAGFEQLRLRTQKQFLLDQGILSRLQNHDAADPFSEAARSNRAIRQLLLSDQMSELFKVLTMVKK